MNAEPWVRAQREFELHGVSRAAIRFVKADFETYDENNRARAQAALINSGDRAVVDEYFDQLRVEAFPDLGGYKVNFWRMCFHSKSDFKSIHPNNYFETIHDSLFDAALFEAPNKAQFVLEYAHGATPSQCAKLVELSNAGIGQSAKTEAVLLLQHMPATVAA